MLFNSTDFLVFFPLVVLIYYIIPDKVKHLWLLAASYYFYMCWNAKYALLIFTSTVITYLSGLFIEKVKQSGFDNKKSEKLKRIVVAISFISNLGILFYYKYFNFAIDILSRSLAKISINLNISTFDIILPVGISFYTFQALSYTMDVYRDEIYAEKNFFRYALFVSFFPQLVAGPIERSKNLLKQLAVTKKFDFFVAREGFLLMLWGYFMKIVIADRVAIFVDTVYGNYAVYEGYYLIVATVLFGIQIYCDFSGYSCIAMGAAKILGIELMENFNAPYLSTTVADFWRNWHISLTSWFKDYLYIPLGGSRRGKLRKYINKMIVFLVSGLWHGSKMTFVIWGGLNGLYQVIGEVIKPARDKLEKILHIDSNNIVYKIVNIVGTFILVDFAWIFFRADSITVALGIVKSIFHANNPWIFTDTSIYYCGLNQKNIEFMLLAILVLLFADICKRKGIRIITVVVSKNMLFRWLFISLSIVVILTFGIWGPGYSAANFLYFQF